MNKNLEKISILGVGYVGLPLLVSLSKFYKCIGFDINKKKIKNLKKGKDETNFFSKKNLKKINFTSNINDIKKSNVYIICVPTPVKNNKPDLNNIKKACFIISKVLKKKDLIIFESTYAPGTTENLCLKIIEKNSKLNRDDFEYGYSPERINPGDTKNNLKNLVKIISANNDLTLKKMAKIYSKVSKNLHELVGIKSAESAKIIENIQRDLNIAYFNCLTMIFSKLKLNSKEIFSAAATKWNFLKMSPGLVGGHCIPVDPYYFHEYLKFNNVKSNFLISGRKINEEFTNFIKNKILKLIRINKFRKVLFLGLTYKENVPDFRNSKALKLYNAIIKNKNLKIFAYDPYAKGQKIYNLINKSDLKKTINASEIIITLVKHKEFLKISFKNKNYFLEDLISK